MAERVCSGQTQQLHHFVCTSPWDCEPLERALRQAADALVGGGNDAVLIIDDTALPKQGRHSVGVKRQYCGVLGKQANCQVMVSLTLARGEVPDLAVPPHLNLPIYIVSQLGDYTAPTRRTPMLCTPKRLKESIDLKLDAAYRIVRAPQNLTETGPDGISFKAQYLLDGNHLTGTRELLLDHSRYVCDPAQYAARREVAQRIAKHLRTPILYTQ